jgi:hypothetical protein
MFKMKLGALLMVLMLGLVNAGAQIAVPNTFTDGTGNTIYASEVNENFSTIAGAALARNGGTITGNISVNPGVTIDGVDIGSVLGGSGTLTLTNLTVTGSVTLPAVAGSQYSVGIGTSNNLDIGGATLIYWGGGITAADITGIANGVPGRILYATTDPAAGSNLLQLIHESGSSLAANRITSSTGANLEVGTGDLVQLIYIGSRWLAFPTKT